MDFETVQTLLLKVAVFAPITTGVVQVVKMTELVPARFLPLVSVVIGAGFGYLFIAASLLGALGGIALGLAAVGLFEFGKSTVAGK